MTTVNDVMYSLKKALKEFAPTTWIYDGVSLTGKAKPFLTVESLTGTIDRYSKDNYARNHLIQIGVYSDTVSNRNELQDKIIDRLERRPINLYDTSSKVPTPVGLLYAEVSSCEPIPQVDITQVTAKHLSFITIRI
ncbi:hypothetical protein COM06_20115 [Bacillus toyonensis]|uniref:hypothetical protein n=1 Tax=Bacillus toyonensis TaxID=155322 RepID=UPI000BF342A7|nr:hypothetical protein [Bacillus toyonensis]MBH0359005.1 hypothetical protein [Bacillus toyonensis biovar Thuringiensis]PGB24803.1 hypothetical protein COM06_20115 [Bacillus toyonensis]PHF10423.1 hypothetical protein COF83_26520 [Bacillus toyonensis]PHF38440.1 hypothetical protein COI39_27920 [Bacillus toyonensis]